jgi:hypothetical protein
VPEERSGIEKFLGGVDRIRRFLGALIVVAIAVASFKAGGTAGWVLGGCLLAFLAGGAALDRRRRWR